MVKQKQEQVYKTKYDKKMAEREQQKKKDARSLQRARVLSVVLAVAVLAAIIIPIVSGIVKKKEAISGIYVKINEHEISGLEYDFYYNTTVNNYINTYGSFLQYMNLDTTKDFATQQYTEDLTWKDYFDEMTVEQIKQTYALLDDATKNAFSYDATEEYDTYIASIKEAAQTTGSNMGDYYHSYFGKYATEANVAAYIKDGIVANAYYDKLLEDNKPTDEEIQNYYQENKNSYDQVDYKSYVSSSDLGEDATEEEKNKDMQERLASVNENGEALEMELTEGAKMSAVPAVAADWLFDETRKEGDTEVFTDDTSYDVYAIQFVKRYYNEANNENISQTLASQAATDYSYGLVENYTVTDVKGTLKYLTVPAATASPEESGEETSTEE